MEKPLSGYKDTMRPLIEKDIAQTKNILTSLQKDRKPCL